MNYVNPKHHFLTTSCDLTLVVKIGLRIAGTKLLTKILRKKTTLRSRLLAFRSSLYLVATHCAAMDC